jgi:hypothetical protein
MPVALRTSFAVGITSLMHELPSVASSAISSTEAAVSYRGRLVLCLTIVFKLVVIDLLMVHFLLKWVPYSEVEGVPCI